MAGKEKKSVRNQGIFQVIKELDEKISLSMSLSASKESPLGNLRPHMKGLELSCHGAFWISGCLVCLWFTSDPLKEAFFFNLLLALLLDVVLVAVLKASFRRKRPSNNEGDDMFLTLSVDKMSCPSGHTSRALLMALLLISSSPHLYLLHPVLILWSFSTCLSRILLGRHHLGDVLIAAAVRNLKRGKGEVEMKTTWKGNKGHIEVKTMLHVWWNFNNPVHWELVPHGRALIGNLYANQLQHVYNVLCQHYHAMVNQKRVLVQFDNTPCHRSMIVHQKIQDLDGIKILPQPAYSQDLAPLDFHLFRSMAHFLAGRQFHSLEAVKEGITEFFCIQASRLVSLQHGIFG